MRNLKKVLKGLVVGGASMGLVAGMALPAAAASQPFQVSVVGGELVISPATGPNELGGAPACSNGEDDEYDAPFLPSLDGLIDYPADPECATPFDNNERDAGFQAPEPVSMTGTIDDVTGAWSVPMGGLVFPASTLTLTSPLVVFVMNSVTQDAVITGTSDLAGSGAVDVTSIDLGFNLSVCITAFGCLVPPPDQVSAGWTVNCIADVAPPDLESADPGAGVPYDTASGQVTVADTDTGGGTGFSIPVPIDAVPPGAIACALLAGSFGLPTVGTSEITLVLSTNGPLNPSYIAIGNAVGVEPGAIDGTVKMTFPIIVYPAVAGSDLTYVMEATGVTATEGKQKPSTPSSNDFKSLDAKTGTIKIGKVAGKAAITVWGDGVVEGDETFEVAISSVSQPGYTIVKGTALGTIVDSAGGNVVSAGDVDVVEGSVAGGTVKGTVGVALDGPAAAADILVTYCTSDVTAVGGTASPADFKAVSCATPKTKTIKLGKSSTSISVTVYSDSTAETDESAAVWIIGVSGGGATIGDGVGIVNIKADE